MTKANMQPSAMSKSISHHLQSVRKTRGLSLDKTAQLTGVSKAMLGQIERGESSPTIATLWKIATGLECSFSSFLSDDDLEPSSEHADTKFANDTNVTIKTLFSFNAATQFEMFELCLKDCHEQHSSAHQIGVTEHIHVLQGKLGVLQDGQWQTYQTQEQCVLRADQPHGYRDEVGETRFIVVIHYPT
ncbi:helix-turn-helix transcriptional regulator [Alteromonas sp. IB21]|uniref:helix-turn-helix domain-containing protein n=1 Tax=Alteromonas sp. IB21 TaxID=2779369 RepID=UPI0018E829F3|nr:XRE family transcriptional regulator [Alteromonas sp. IB21]MBJ2128157.1 helix-turn-helix transcriptional regulator [Alteromonas sp. IB21]